MKSRTNTNRYSLTRAATRHSHGSAPNDSQCHRSSIHTDGRSTPERRTATATPFNRAHRTQKHPSPPLPRPHTSAVFLLMSFPDRMMSRGACATSASRGPKDSRRRDRRLLVPARAGRYRAKMSCKRAHVCGNSVRGGGGRGGEGAGVPWASHPTCTRAASCAQAPARRTRPPRTGRAAYTHIHTQGMKGRAGESRKSCTHLKLQHRGSEPVLNRCEEVCGGSLPPSPLLPYPRAFVYLMLFT